jgi:hypothetical protein
MGPLSCRGANAPYVCGYTVRTSPNLFVKIEQCAIFEKHCEVGIRYRNARISCEIVISNRKTVSVGVSSIGLDPPIFWFRIASVECSSAVHLFATLHLC